ncbi:hypothetical protein, partial [Rhodopirellula bahusiensis]
MTDTHFQTVAQCCGCQTFAQVLNPDFYRAVEVASFVKERTVTTTQIVTREMTRTGEDETEGEIVDDTEDTTDVPLERIDAKPVAGRWEWVYPQTESFEDTEPELVGGIESFQRVTTYVDVTIHEERRLFLRFNVANQFRFGLEDDNEDPYIESSHFKVTVSKYLRSGFPIAPISGPIPDGEVRYLTTEDATAKGFAFDAETPADSDAFDTLFGELTNSHDLEAGPPEGDTLHRDCETWLPDEATDSLALLIDAPGAEDQGVQLSGVKLSINDVEDRSNSSLSQQYDWSRDWIREDEHNYVTRRTFQKRDIELDLTGILQSDWLNNPTHRFKVELFTEALVEGEVEETTYLEQEFFVELGDAIEQTQFEIDNELPVRYEWFLKSEGSWGDIEVEDEDTSTTVSPFDMAEVRIVIREEVVEINGGTTGNVYYEMAPFYPEEPPPRCKLRVTATGTQPKWNTFAWTQVIHEEYSRNLTCPEAETCPIISPHSHVEWRVKAHSLPNGGAVGLPDFHSHQGCGIVANVPLGDVDDLEVTGTHVTYLTNWEAQYDPSASSIWGVSSGFIFVKMPEDYEGEFNFDSSDVAGNEQIIDIQLIGPTPGDFTILSGVENHVDWEVGTPNDYTLIIARETIPYWLYGTMATMTPAEMAAIEDSYIESIRVPLTHRTMHFPGNPDPETPSLSAGSPISGFYTIVDSSSIVIGDVSGYGVTVSMHEAFQESEDVDGLPPYTITGVTPDYYYYRVTSGSGVSLLFERVLDDFAIVHQESQPSFESVLDSSVVAEIAAAIEDQTYWYEVDGEFYSIASTGQEGPFEESGFVPPVPMVDVQVDYMSVFYQSCSAYAHIVDSASYCADAAIDAEDTVTTDGPPAEDDDLPEAPTFPDSIEWGVDFAGAGSPPHSHTGDISKRTWTLDIEHFDDGMGTSYDQGSLDFSQENIFDTDVWVTSMAVGSQKYTYKVPVNNPDPPPASIPAEHVDIASWLIPGDPFDKLWNRGYVTQNWETSTTEINGIIVAYWSTKSVVLRKRVEKWSGTTPPDVDFVGSEDGRFVDEEDGKYWRLTGISVGQPDEPNPSATLAKVCMSAVEVDLRDLTITIGPEEVL